MSTPRQKTINSDKNVNRLEKNKAEEIFVSLFVFEAVLHEVAWLLAQIGAVWG